MFGVKGILFTVQQLLLELYAYIVNIMNGLLLKVKMRCLALAFLLYLLPMMQALDNGLALTPPMGWLSWERFTCNIQCKEDPDNCISEKLYKDMADRLVDLGLKDMGYEYVNIDDCWMDKTRDATTNRLRSDPVRFPNGIKPIADYVHAKGLKLGIYIDCGTKTCAGYPGSYGYFDIDSETFAEWGIDMLKVDGCYADPKEMDTLYPSLAEALNRTQRPIVYSCSWPAYQVEIGIKPDYKNIAKHCNLWRNFNDIEDSWQSVLSIIDFYAQNQDDLIAAAGPGHWNDPDMIIAGNFGLSYDEAKAQLALWAIMASPLLMSNDLRSIKPEFLALLKNTEVVKVNQDPLGIMGRRIYANNSIEIWKRPISPVISEEKYSFALVFFNRRTLGGPVTVTAEFGSLGLKKISSYNIYDAFGEKDMKLDIENNEITVKVNPSGVRMILVKNT